IKECGYMFIASNGQGTNVHIDQACTIGCSLLFNCAEQKDVTKQFLLVPPSQAANFLLHAPLQANDFIKTPYLMSGKQFEEVLLTHQIKHLKVNQVCEM